MKRKTKLGQPIKDDNADMSKPKFVRRRILSEEIVRIDDVTDDGEPVTDDDKPVVDERTISLQKIPLPDEDVLPADINDRTAQPKAGQSKPYNRMYDVSKLHKLSVSKLIQCGESHTIEFKETLEYDARQNQHNKNLSKECLKTIAAFLNTDGGALLIGVRDNGEVTGIGRDLPHVQRKNQDGFELKLRNLIRNRLSPPPLGKIKVAFEKLEEQTVCRIDISPLGPSQVVHLDNEVYIRDGNMTIKLTGRDLTDWIQHRTQSSRKEGGE